MTSLETLAVTILASLLVGSLRARRHLEAERRRRGPGLPRWRFADPSRVERQAELAAVEDGSAPCTTGPLAA